MQNALRGGKMNFIGVLNDLIKEHNISKSKFLSDLNLGKNSFVNWQERGTIPSGDVLIKIADYLNVSVDYLLGRTEHISNSITNSGTNNGTQANIINNEKKL